MRTKLAAILVLAVCLAAACAAARLEWTLSPPHREFLSQVRYLISKKERRTFLNLPAAERDAFIGEFWKNRDPDPDTEENEFRDRYFNRIEEANRLFKATGAPGWLQDRGRIYILLGPPEERETYPRGRSLYDPPYEVWYYGFFPILFIDKTWSGDYTLEPESAMQIALINEAQMEQKPKAFDSKPTLEFALQVETGQAGEVRVRIKIPYKAIWFSSEGRTLKTNLEMALAVTALDDNGQDRAILYEERKSYPLSLEENEWLKNIGRGYLIETSASRLPPGRARVQVKITNLTDGTRTTKQALVTIEE
jgi:GWxTD domain-containing protein